VPLRYAKIARHSSFCQRTASLLASGMQTCPKVGIQASQPNIGRSGGQNKPLAADNHFK